MNPPTSSSGPRNLKVFHRSSTCFWPHRGPEINPPTQREPTQLFHRSRTCFWPQRGPEIDPPTQREPGPGLGPEARYDIENPRPKP